MPFTRAIGGGSFFSAALLARGLLSLGHNVKAVFPEEGPAVDLFRRNNISARITESKSLGALKQTPSGLARFALGSWQAHKGAVRFLRRHSFDFVHCNDDTSMLPWAYAAKKANIKCIWHVRTARPGLSDKLRLMFSERAICISNFVAQRLPESPKKCVLYNPVDTEMFRPVPDKAIVRRRLGLPIEGMQFIHIGRDAAYKRPELSVTALAAALNGGINAWLVFLGDFQVDRQVGLIRSLPRDYRDRIIFAGWVDNPETWLSCSDLLLHPAKGEHFGRIFVEAAACQVPFLATDTGAAPELVDAGLGGFIHPDWEDSSFQRFFIEICQSPRPKRRMPLPTPIEHAKAYLALID